MTEILLAEWTRRGREPPNAFRVAAGRALFAQGDRFHGVFAVRSGTLKSVFVLTDGREQVCAFPMVGDVIGLDALVSGVHGTTMTALEDTHVSRMAGQPWAQAAECDDHMRQRLSELMAKDLQRSHGIHALLGCANAQERLAAFLLDQSRRWHAQGCSPCDFHLRMTRAEIGSFLCMSMETVSRTLSAMQRKGWLRVDKRRIILVDVGGFARRFSALP